MFVLVEQHLALPANRVAARSKSKIFENVGTVADQPRPTSQERVSSLGGLGEDASGNDEHLPPLIGGKGCGDQGPAP